MTATEKTAKADTGITLICERFYGSYGPREGTWVWSCNSVIGAMQERDNNGRYNHERHTAETLTDIFGDDREEWPHGAAELIDAHGECFQIGDEFVSAASAPDVVDYYTDCLIDFFSDKGVKATVLADVEDAAAWLNRAGCPAADLYGEGAPDWGRVALEVLGGFPRAEVRAALLAVESA